MLLVELLAYRMLVFGGIAVESDSEALRVPILSGIGKPKTVRSDEKLTAFVELEAAIRATTKCLSRVR